MSELEFYKLFHRASALASPNFISVVDFGINAEIYDKSEADKVIEEKNAAIAELKAEINRKEAVGQRWFERCMEARTENVRSKHALWLARALRAESVMEYLTMKCKYFEKSFGKDAPKCDVDLLAKWAKIISKCRAKAEEY